MHNAAFFLCILMFFHFNIIFNQNRIKIRKFEKELIENVIFAIFNSLLIICGVNQRPVSKSVFANLTTVLSSTCFHYRCAASLILTSTVPGVTPSYDWHRTKTSPVIKVLMRHFFLLTSICIIQSGEGTTKTLIKLQGCAYRSASLLFAHGIKQVFSWRG